MPSYIPGDDLDDSTHGWQDMRPDLDPFLMSMPGETEDAPTVCIATSGQLTNEQLQYLIGQAKEGLRAFLERYGATGA